MLRSLLRRSAANLLLAISAVLLTLLAAEGVFRLLDLRGHYRPRDQPGHLEAQLPEPDKLIPGVRKLFRPHASFAHVYETNPRGYFDENNTIRYELNRYGFRGPSWKPEKPPGTLRVAFLGDSFTFGSGVRYQDTFVARVGRSLSGRAEVIGMAIGEWGTLDEINYLKHVGLDFSPDLVILVFVLNDADYAGGLDLWVEFRRRYQSRRFASSYLASYLHAVLARRALAEKYIKQLASHSRRDQKRWDRSFRALGQGRDMVEAAGGRFAVAIFPFLYQLDEGYPFRKLHEWVASSCVRQGIEVIDLATAFAGQDHEALWVHPSDQHPNERGHAIAAQALLDFIVDRELLPAQR